MKDDKLQEILHYLNLNIDLLDIIGTIDFYITKIVENDSYWIDIYFFTKNNFQLVTKIITKEKFKQFQIKLIKYHNET